jgi:hypothetical protein
MTSEQMRIGLDVLESLGGWVMVNASHDIVSLSTQHDYEWRAEDGEDGDSDLINPGPLTPEQAKSLDDADWFLHHAWNVWAHFC